MKLSTQGRKALEDREGCRLVAYQDSRGIWTIGYGHTNGVVKGHMISQTTADELFEKDIAIYSRAVSDAVKVTLTQNQFDALVSFTYNIGITGFKGSSTLKSLNAKDYSAAADNMLKWEKPAVLKKRREGERAQFLTPEKAADAAQPKENVMATVSPTTTVAKTNHVDVLAGLENFFGSIVNTVSSGFTAVTSNSVNTGNVVVGSVSDVESAISEIEAVIADIKAKKYTDAAGDVLHLVTTVFSILSRFGINIPGATEAVKIATSVATSL